MQTETKCDATLRRLEVLRDDAERSLATAKREIAGLEPRKLAERLRAGLADDMQRDASTIDQVDGLLAGLRGALELGGEAACEAEAQRADQRLVGNLISVFSDAEPQLRKATRGVLWALRGE